MADVIKFTARRLIDRINTLAMAFGLPQETHEAIVNEILLEAETQIKASASQPSERLLPVTQAALHRLELL